MLHITVMRVMESWGQINHLFLTQSKRRNRLIEETTDYVDYTDFLFFLRVHSCNFVAIFIAGRKDTVPFPLGYFVKES